MTTDPSTAWPDGALRCPLGGGTLRADAPHSLAAGGTRWPVVENIPFLRADRRALAAEALAALDAGDPAAATALLLRDQDNWARSAPPDEPSRRRAVAEADRLSFRDAMDLLAFGPVGTYFAHRWSDPTFLSGLALAEAHGLEAPVFELACGAGHFLREFARADGGGQGNEPASGGDIVWSKLWLARRFVAPDARLLCFDAAEPWPFADAAFGTVFCHDAFYFLPRKPHVAAEMRRVARRVLIGHAHNALAENLSAGEPLTPEAYAALFPGAVLYDDRELTAALAEARTPAPGNLDAAPALSWAWNAGDVAPPAAPVRGGLAVPPPGTLLRLNPLYAEGRVRWPSPRYQAEYGPLATYPAAFEGPETAVAGADPATDALARRRVLLDLPASW